MVTISTRQLGKALPVVDDWLLPPWPENAEHGEAMSLRELISRTVRAEVRQYSLRQKERLTFRVLTETQIQEAAAKGKVESGGIDPARVKPVDEEAAVGAALQAFEDGLYLVMVDEVEQRDLDAAVYLKSDSRVTYIRLVMLAGG